MNNSVHNVFLAFGLFVQAAGCDPEALAASDLALEDDASLATTSVQVEDGLADGEPVDDVIDVIEPAADFPSASCQSGFRQAGARLCISDTVQNAENWYSAVVHCTDKRARVCAYEDLLYLYYRSTLDASYNPSGKHFGNHVGDDQVLVGNASITYDNDPDRTNFDGIGGKGDVRPYWCCHDDDL